MMLALRLIDLIYKIQYIIDILILINICLSWLPQMDNSFTRAVYSVTEPMLAPFRKLLYSIIDLPMDFSPILFGFALNFVVKVLVQLIIRIFLY